MYKINAYLTNFQKFRPNKNKTSLAQQQCPDMSSGCRTGKKQLSLNVTEKISEENANRGFLKTYRAKLPKNIIVRSMLLESKKTYMH